MLTDPLLKRLANHYLAPGWPSKFVTFKLVSYRTHWHGIFVINSPTRSPHVIGLPLYEMFRKGKSIEAENSLVIAWGSGWEKGRTIAGHEVSFFFFIVNFFFKHLYWSIIALQCFVTFCCITK